MCLLQSLDVQENCNRVQNHQIQQSTWWIHCTWFWNQTVDVQNLWQCTEAGKLPAEAKANNLDLEDIPSELSGLNSLEVQFISLRIPFMKMVALPCGKQRAIHGPAVNVPADLTPVCSLLPRLPMKLKRKLCYKGHFNVSICTTSPSACCATVVKIE